MLYLVLKGPENEVYSRYKTEVNTYIVYIITLINILLVVLNHNIMLIRVHQNDLNNIVSQRKRSFP